MRLLALLALAACSLSVVTAVRSDVAKEAAAISASVTVSVSSPDFCHDLDCPNYKVVETVTQRVELRKYEPSVWVSTNVSGASSDEAIREGFWRLFNYIGGDNVDGAKIPMTAPVRTRLIPGQGPTCASTFVVSFFVPFDMQKDGPPKPKSADVYISRERAASFFVLSYPGYTSQDKILKRASELLDILDSHNINDYDYSHFYSAGYDSPFRLLNRHNEVWIPARP